MPNHRESFEGQDECYYLENLAAYLDHHLKDADTSYSNRRYSSADGLLSPELLRVEDYRTIALLEMYEDATNLQYTDENVPGARFLESLDDVSIIDEELARSVFFKEMRARYAAVDYLQRQMFISTDQFDVSRLSNTSNLNSSPAWGKPEHGVLYTSTALVQDMSSWDTHGTASYAPVEYRYRIVPDHDAKVLHLGALQDYIDCVTRYPLCTEDDGKKLISLNWNKLREQYDVVHISMEAAFAITFVGFIPTDAGRIQGICFEYECTVWMNKDKIKAEQTFCRSCS